MSSRRRPVLIGFVAMLAVLLVAEGAARAVAPGLPEPDRWGDQARAVKVAQMDRLREPDGTGCVDVVVAGDSMARDGIDPVAFQRADPDGRDAYNASLDAAGPDLLHPWLTEQVVPRLRPATVVVALSSIDLNRNGPAAREAVAAYTGSREGRPDLLGRLDRAASDVSALVDHRRSLRQPSLVWAALRGEAPPARVAVDPEGWPVLPGVLGPRGEGLSRRGLHYTGPGPATAFTRDRLLADFAVGDDPQGDVVRLIADLRHADVEVALLVLPVTDDYAALHPGGGVDLETARAAVLGAAETTGVPVVDLLDAGWPDSAFADTHHLNSRGAERLSAELPGLLRQAGAPLPGCARRSG